MKLFHMGYEELDALHQKMAALFLCARLKGNLDNAISAALNAALPEIEKHREQLAASQEAVAAKRAHLRIVGK